MTLLPCSSLSLSLKLYVIYLSSNYCIPLDLRDLLLTRLVFSNQSKPFLLLIKRVSRLFRPVFICLQKSTTKVYPILFKLPVSQFISCSLISGSTLLKD